MYIRFVSLDVDPESGQPQGILRAANGLVKDGDLSEIDKACIGEIFDWFNANLTVPDIRYNQGKAVFWFLDSAHEHIKRMWHLTNILRSHGCDVEVKICRTIYSICYKDDCQIAAIPNPNNSKVMIK